MNKLAAYRAGFAQGYFEKSAAMDTAGLFQHFPSSDEMVNYIHKMDNATNGMFGGLARHTPTMGGMMGSIRNRQVDNSLNGFFGDIDAADTTKVGGAVNRGKPVTMPTFPHESIHMGTMPRYEPNSPWGKPVPMPTFPHESAHMSIMPGMA